MDSSELNAVFEKYKNNYKEVYRFSHYRFSLSGSDEELIQQIKNNSFYVQQLKDENNHLLKTYIDPLLKEETVLSEDEITVLTKQAAGMIDHVQTLDSSLAHYIYRKLLSHYEQKQDTEKVIMILYYCGFAYYEITKSLRQCNGVANYVENPYFEKAITYLPQYDSFSNETRNYLFRCLHNRSLKLYPSVYETNYMHEYMHALREERAFLDNPHYRQLNPEFPWARYKRACLQQAVRMLQCIDTEEGRQYKQEIISYVRQLLDSDAKFDPRRYVMIQYHCGDITIHELVLRFLDMYARRDVNHYSSEAMELNLKIPTYICMYLKRDDEISQDEKYRILRQLNADVYAYLLKYRFEDNIGKVTSLIIDYIEGFEELDDTFDFRKFAGDMFKVIHLPTYIHSLMVSRIAVAMTAEILEVRPELFVGYRGLKCVDEVLSKKDEILQYMKLAGILHDVGKLNVLDFVTQYARKLYDLEFDFLKYHPTYGYEKMKQYDSTDEFAMIVDCHHLSYDLKNGYMLDSVKEHYPEIMDHKIAIDIIAIADSIDAATDKIGRSYAVGKDFDVLLRELETGRGHRYNPDLVDLLEKDSLQQKIQSLLDVERRKIYVSTYRDTQ